MSGDARIIRILRPQFPKDKQVGLVVVGCGALLTIILGVFVAPVAWLFLISIIFCVMIGVGLVFAYVVEGMTSQITITDAGFTEVCFGVATMSYAWADVGAFVVDTHFLSPTVSFVDRESRKRHLCYRRIFIYCGDLETLAAVLNEARTNYMGVPAAQLPVSR